MRKVFLTFWIVVGLGCAQDRLKELERLYKVNSLPITAKLDFCTIEATKVKSRLKFIFVIDKSGSNQDNGGELGTDPDGARRYTPLLSFLNETSDDETVYYSLVNFATDAWIASQLTNDREAFQDTIEFESNPGGSNPPLPVDGGWTNYLASLNQAYNLIDRDIRAAKELPEIVSSYYVVFFVTDGFPTVGGAAQSRSDILNAINTIKSLEIGAKEYVDSIQLHTGFYYRDTPDIDAQALLSDMASQGVGEFYSFGAGQVIDFSQFAVPERKVKHSLRDILVSNVSTTWDGASLTLDSDTDGMSDLNEVTFGSDPDDPDTDGNGVSDGVEFKTTGKPCQGVNCSPTGATQYRECDLYRIASPVGQTLFRDLDKDLLNDCEERVVLRSKLDNFDSNGDWIPDELAYRGDIALMEGITETTLDPDADGLSNYGEIKVHTPTRYPNDKIYGVLPYNYTISTKSDDASKTCYSVEVKNISAIGPDNEIRAYLIENSAIIDGKKFLRIAQKRASGTSVTFSAEDFK